MIGLGRAVDLSVVCGPARHWIICGYFKVYFIRFWTRYTGGKVKFLGEVLPNFRQNISTVFMSV